MKIARFVPVVVWSARCLALVSILTLMGAVFVPALPAAALVAYCNFAVIYRRSPVGLPVPEVLKQAKLGDNEEKLNRLLQELAWDAVVQHRLSGVRLTP